jgi:hypothetical protein
VWFVRWVALALVLVGGPVGCAALLRGGERPRPAAGVLLLAGGVEVAGVAALGLPAGAGWGLWSVPAAMAAAGVLGTACSLWVIVRAGLWRGGRRREGALLVRVGLPVAGAYERSARRRSRKRAAPATKAPAANSPMSQQGQ